MHLFGVWESLLKTWLLVVINKWWSHGRRAVRKLPFWVPDANPYPLSFISGFQST